MFGGDHDLTDIAVAAGLIDLGDRSRVRQLAAGFVDAVLARAASMVEENVDRMKTAPATCR